MKLIFFLLLAACCSCLESVPGVSSKSGQLKEDPEVRLLEEYTDSLSIGRSGDYKIHLWSSKNRSGWPLTTEFELYEKIGHEWKVIQHHLIEKKGLMPLSPEYADFNNDGFIDLTFVSDDAARGANELRSLFIFDSLQKKLVFIEGSENCSNIRYNSDLDCIDCWAFSGSTTTSFMKIEEDSLIRFACVDQDHSTGQIESHIHLSNGETKTLHEITNTGFSFFARFENYDPVTELCCE